MKHPSLQFIAAGFLADTTEGQKLVARFCMAVDAGEVPDARDMKLLRDGLSLFLSDEGTTEDRASKVAKRLGITKKQGRQPRTYFDVVKYGRSVLEYEDMVAATGDEKEARRVICEKYQIAWTTMRDRIKEYGPDVPLLRELDELTQRALAVRLRK